MIPKKRKHNIIDLKALLQAEFARLKNLILLVCPISRKLKWALNTVSSSSSFRIVQRLSILYSLSTNLTIEKEKIQKAQKNVSKLQLKAKQKALDPKLEDIYR